MGKDPAFLFYPGDWTQGTQYYTFEEKGAYITLLCLQFDKETLTDDLIKRTLGIRYKMLWPVIKEKFKIENETYYNEKLLEVMTKRKAFTESRRQNRLGKTKQVKDTSLTSVPQVEDVTVNGDQKQSFISKERDTGGALGTQTPEAEKAAAELAKQFKIVGRTE